MAPPQRARVLRCGSCRLFQAHQVKKSVKWTCKACGEKQSFLRAYGEGSGADCRHHVQKLNLLQGHVSELSLRSLEGPVGASEEEPVGHQQDDNVSLQEKPQTSESRWLKYLEKDSQKLELERVCFDRQPSSKTEPDCPFSQDLPRKRKWSQSTVQPPCSFDVQGLGNSEVTLEPQMVSRAPLISPPLRHPDLILQSPGDGPPDDRRMSFCGQPGHGI
nr:MRN complex-interacting protein isoform X5 [Microcebus murinus]XP_012645388.1 MRN complex-interacting protein isoform X5 [Microcebus murinus]